MSGTPDLFVVCKKCGSEVSPYITECPYCGTRLRKRAPKIERDGGGEAKPQEPKRRVARPKAVKPAKAPKPRRERSGPSPFAGDPFARPVATLTIVLLSLFGYLSLAFVTRGEVALLSLESEPWRLATSVLVYPSAWYELLCLLAIGVFGWRLELRHGPVLVVALFLACGVGANAVAAAVEPDPFVLGAPGAALGMLAAWAVPDVRRARRGVEHDGDLLGTAVLGVAIGFLPLAVVEASALATAIGGLLGLVAGLLLARSPVNAD